MIRKRRCSVPRLALRAGLLCFASVCCLGLSAADLARIGERNWQRIEFGEISMLTDLASQPALELLRDLEVFRTLVDRYVEPAATAGPLRLVVFARRRDFVRLFQPRHFAAFTVPELGETLLLVAPQGGRSSLREHLRHEYVHYRMRTSGMGGVPVWYEEGLATMLAAVRLSREVSKTTGQVAATASLGRWRELAEPFWFPLGRLLPLRDVSGLASIDAQRFYASSHALVQRLHLVDQVPVAEVIAMLGSADGHPATLLGVSPGRLDTLMRDSFPRRKGELLRVELPALDPLAMAPGQPIGTTQVLRELAALTTSLNPPAAAELYAELTQREPDAAWAWAGRADALRLLQQAEPAREALTQALALAPDAPDVLLAEVMLDTHECILVRDATCAEAWRRAAVSLRQALDIDPRQFEVIYRLGIAELYQGRAGASIGYLTIALQRAPWSPRVNYFIGEAYRLVGDTRAGRHLHNAWLWAGSEFFREAAKAALGELRTADEQAATMPR